MSNLYQYNGKEWIEISKNGKDASIDYGRIIAEVVKLIPKPKDAEIKDISPQEIRDLLELLQGDDRLDMKHIKGLSVLEKELKGIRTAYQENPMLHPVALSNLPDVTIAGIVSGQSIRWNGTYFEAYTPSTSSDIQIPIGTVDGSNTVFVFTSAPSVIVVDNRSLRQTSGDGTVNWTGTTTVTLTVAPNFDVFGS